MPSTRAPLPALGLGPSHASDWATGETSPHVVFRRGRWWTTYHYNTTSRDYERDRERIRRRLAVSRFLSSQSTDPGL